ncbi:MAG TPA: response regulator transcription factor [Polyangia bacterium]|nr:response regulator transcription factor [Polyangia bacterium]
MLTTIVLADDHQVVLEGLKALLAAEPDFRLVGEASDGLRVVPLCVELRPQVLVLDLMMPGLNGLEVTRQLKQRLPETRVVVLSMHASEAYVSEALRGGAWAYVLKKSQAKELVTAIREVVAGRRYLSPPLSEQGIESWQSKARAAALDPFETLTQREREVLQLAAEGQTNVEIGERLRIGKRTVETHRASLMRKLALRSQADLIRYALRRGIISVE